MPAPRAPATEWYKGETLNPRVFCQHVLSTRVAPPNPHDLEQPVLLTRVAPPNPSRFGPAPEKDKAAPQKDKDWTPPTLHDLEWLPKRTRMGPPQRLFPSRRLTDDFFYQILHIKCAIYIGLSADLGVPLKDRGCAPQPFTKGSGSQKKQGWDPPNPSRFGRRPKRTRIGPPNPSRLGVAPQKDKDGTPPTLHDLDGAPKGQGC